MLTVIGEALVDVVHSNDAPMHAYPGGSPSTSPSAPRG